ncbi:hypothetical protein NDU88_002078 [Pleurodeles waltl]|uniref:Uncharacterized protein n=1 Tax=Pleurodeles waltl TaxID=8319 RepID=A0AAV7P8W9_PLEWA|nr:hypothetical protein NDU88_002078 [Pleurodeles waltl]
MVSLNWRGAEERLAVGVIPTLGEDLIIGTDYEDFIPLLAKASLEYLINTWWEDAPYVKAEVEESPKRLNLSRKQKQEQLRYYHANPVPGSLRPAPQPTTVLTAVGSFRQAQREDPTPKNAWHQALAMDETSVGPTFSKENNLLYRSSPNTPGRSPQLVVPQTHR